MVKNPPANAGDIREVLGQEDPLEEGMATHSSIFAWRIPWMEELGRLESTGHKESNTTERLHFHFINLQYSGQVPVCCGEKSLS